MSGGAVVRTADIPAEVTPDGGRVHVLFDGGPGGPGFARRAIELPPGSLFGGTAGPAGELWFVMHGRGQLDVEGLASLPLGPDQGLWIPSAAVYQVLAGGDADLRLDIVTLPAVTAAAVTSAAATPASANDPVLPLSRELRECEVERTGNREFRVLFGPGRGCSVATQFVGEIPPGRAPEHAHPYDEVVLVLQGEGIAHVGSTDHVLGPGTCAHLPPGLLHCLENTGTAPMRVLGVFHPADSPAAKLAPGS